MTEPRSAFEIVSAESNASTLTIRDLNHGMSVTNDAERLVAWLHAEGILAGRRLLYYDTMNELSELAHKNGEFTGFRPYDIVTKMQ